MAIVLQTTEPSQNSFVVIVDCAKCDRVFAAELYRSLQRCVFIALVFLGLGGGARAEDLPLMRVVLSNSGLAQFTHSGSVTAGSNIDLAVRLDQVDDVLKSLTIFDKEGAIGAISLPGKTPLAELFRDLPFGPAALDSSATLLNALVGSEVEIEGAIAAKGRVFHVEDEKVALPNNAGTTTRHRLTLMTDRGLVQAILEDISALRFSDPMANAQIERALSGLRENQAKDRRKLSIGFLGEGTRNAAISYVVAAPVWKTAYRLVLPQEGGKARLQGWAVVENLTGGDWNDIDLVLVSGNPVALFQPLYTALFADRIEVPVTTTARVQPRTDDADEMKKGTRKEAELRESVLVSRPLQPPAGATEAARAKTLVATAAPVPAALLLATTTNTAEAEEASTQLLYRFPAKLSLATGHTMMVPFLDREVSAARTWLYQPETSNRHPLAAVRLRNDGDSGLPAGIVTAFDAGADGINFVGDAQLPLLPKDAVRFVTFALDSRTDVRRDDKGVVRTELGKAVNGTLTLKARSRRTISYEVTAPADEDREIVVEEAREDGWFPSSESENVEKTPTRFRLPITAPKGKTTSTALTLERVDSEEVQLTTLGTEDILSKINGLQNESVSLKETVARLSAIVDGISKAEFRRKALDDERQKITDDQDRIRSNLQSVGQGSNLGQRYIDALKSQEDRLAEIARLDSALEKDIGAKRQAAEDLAHNLTF
jgi:hypothetical protein